jgi:hypothetical protein
MAALRGGGLRLLLVGVARVHAAEDVCRRTLQRLLPVQLALKYERLNVGLIKPFAVPSVAISIPPQRLPLELRSDDRFVRLDRQQSLVFVAR